MTTANQSGGSIFSSPAPQQAAATGQGPVIPPTIGRVVYFYKGAEHKDVPPHAAIVAFVHDERKVNLAIFDHSGAFGGGIKEVQLVQEGDPEPEGSHCRWMPFQLGQARASAAAK